MKQIFSLIKKLLGKNLTQKIRPLGHGIKALIAACVFRFPSKSLHIIGITGTKGKTTTTVFMGRLANLWGVKTGYISTAVVNTTPSVEENIVHGEELNIYKMSTIDAWEMQKRMRSMVNQGCKLLIVELSSQGLEQNRHWGLGDLKAGIFLNLFPEHIESHGGLENYKKAKAKMFTLLGKNAIFASFTDITEAEYMYNAIPQEFQHSCSQIMIDKKKDYAISTYDGMWKAVSIDGEVVNTQLIADFDIENMIIAGKTLQEVQKKTDIPMNSEWGQTKYLSVVPGRMEFVVKHGSTSYTEEEVHNSKLDISILVDYAHESESMRRLLDTLHTWKEAEYFTHIIHVISCDGVGRDDWKKPLLGDISYEKADFTVVTTDNYDTEDNPEDIISLLSSNFPEETRGIKYCSTIQRKDAFVEALTYAKKIAQTNGRPLIVSTGVGSEQGISQPGGVMQWDEREVWRDIWKARNTI